jgi:hypothetical protein
MTAWMKDEKFISSMKTFLFIAIMIIIIIIIFIILVLDC